MTMFGDLEEKTVPLDEASRDAAQALASRLAGGVAEFLTGNGWPTTCSVKSEDARSVGYVLTVHLPGRSALIPIHVGQLVAAGPDHGSSAHWGIWYARGALVDAPEAYDDRAISRLVDTIGHGLKNDLEQTHTPPV
ncbi:hypothetical protein WMF30_55745 [Sorangium sp. So ce134]